MLMLKKLTYIRNRRIYWLSRSVPQTELARQYNLSRARIEEIVQHFKLWGEFA